MGLNRPFAPAQAAHPFLYGPVVAPMLRLALPTAAVALVQVFIGLAHAWFVAQLGTQALAGLAMVFPVMMLMQMVANGGIGSGVASAIARALGADRAEEARALLWHAVVLALVLGALFTAAALVLGPPLYRVFARDAGAVRMAVLYSNATFAGAIGIWLVALLSSALRGAGEARIPARIALVSAAVLVPLSPVLIFGWGPFPAMGIAGGGAAFTAFAFVTALVLLGYLRSGRGPLRLQPVALQARLFKDILGVGTLSSVASAQANVLVACVTGAVGVFGADATAGYGIASRIDYLLISLLFGFGTAVLTMVGMNIGAGQTERAWRIGWIGAAVGFLLSEAIGLFLAAFPHLWMQLFSGDARVLAIGSDYLRTVGPAYGLVGAATMVWYASLGARRPLWPLLGDTARMAVAGICGWFAVARLGVALQTLFDIAALGIVVYLLVSGSSMFAPWWRRHARPAAVAA